MESSKQSLNLTFDYSKSNEDILRRENLFYKRLNPIVAAGHIG